MTKHADRLLFNAVCRVFASPNSEALKARRKIEMPYADFDDLEVIRIERARVPSNGIPSEEIVVVAPLINSESS